MGNQIVSSRGSLAELIGTIVVALQTILNGEVKNLKKLAEANHIPETLSSYELV